MNQTAEHLEPRTLLPRADARRFTLSVLGFPLMTETEATRRLADAFGLPPERAVRYACELPARVASSLTVDQLDVYVSLLHDLGAELRVVQDDGEGRWTVPARHSSNEPVDVEALYRWHGGPKPALRARTAERNTAPRAAVRPTRENDPGEVESSPPESQPQVPVGLSNPDDIGEIWEGEGDEARPTTPEHGVSVYAPPDFEWEGSAWVDRMETSQFFVRGLYERQKRGWLRRKLTLKRANTRLEDVRLDADPDYKSRARQRLAQVVLAVSLAVGAVWAVVNLLPEGPSKLSHTSAVGEFTVRLPDGFVAHESSQGVYPSPLGEMRYSAHTVRKRGDVLGALLFNLLDVPAPMRQRWSERQVLEGAVRAVVSASGGHLIETTRAHNQGRDGLEGRYQVTRFGNTFYGRVQVFDVRGELALLSCEGVGEACLADSRAGQFFGSFSVDLAD